MLDRRLIELYAAHERRLVAQGLMRGDGGGPDTTFDSGDLIRSFIEVALFSEYRETSSGQLLQSASAQLLRWEAPVRIAVTFGAGVPTTTRREDLANVMRYAARLSDVSGHQVSMVEPEEANFHVLVLGEAERRASAPLLRRIVPRISDSTIRTATDVPRSTYCLALAFPEASDTFALRTVIAIVRAEHPSLTRLSCYHEEIAQGLGLLNDSPNARPSIFNDDEEFALLTGHDELLLRMLYDPRLKPGMTAVEAAPIVRIIAEELLPGFGA